MSGPAYNAEGLNPLILLADNHLLAVNKPPALLSQDSGTGLPNLEDWAREWVRVGKNKPGGVFLNAVHRIDRAASGIVLFARTGKALARLNEAIRERRCRKTYHAWVEGVPDPPAGRLAHWLSRGHQRAEVCGEGDAGAQRAVLSYRVLETREEDKALLEVDLETGRYHQIRAQLAALGTPIAGDGRYGARQLDRTGGIALHHRRLEIAHPVLRERIAIEAPYPAGSPWWR